MSIYARRKEWEELQYLGLGLSNSLQISLDMINSTMKSSYEANMTSQKSMAFKTAREAISSIDATSFSGYSEFLKFEYEEATKKRADEFLTLNDQIAKESILQYNKKELFDTAISGSSSFSDKMLEAEKFARNMIEEHTKIATDRFESSFREQIKASIINPAMGYVDEMQKMLNEPMLKMQEYATIGLSSIEKIQKLQEIPYQVELDKFCMILFQFKMTQK